MSHIGNGEDDFEGLDELGLSEDILNNIKQSRMFAREIIDRLEPRYILGWNQLRVILKDALMNLDSEIKLIEMTEKLESTAEKEKKN